MNDLQMVEQIARLITVRDSMLAAAEQLTQEITSIQQRRMSIYLAVKLSPVKDLGLKASVVKRLKNANNIRVIDDLTLRTEVEVFNFLDQNQAEVNTIKKALAFHGMALRAELDGSVSPKQAKPSPVAT